MKVYTDMSKAGKALGARLGYVGKRGGWVYNPQGKPWCLGWIEFGYKMLSLGKLKKSADGRGWFIPEAGA